MKASVKDEDPKESQHRAKEREVKDDTPRGLLGVAHLFHLQVDNQIDEGGKERNEGRDQLLSANRRLQNHSDAQEPC